MMVRKSAGITLIELVITITLIGVMGVAMLLFMNQLIQIYFSEQLVAQLFSQQALAMERMVREIRQAVPSTVVVSDQGKQIEFDVVHTAGYATEVHPGVIVDQGNPYLGIGTVGGSLILRAYSPSTRLVFPIIGGGVSRLNIAGLPADSPHRYFVTTKKVRFVQVGNRVYRWQNDVSRQTVNPTAPGHLLVEGIHDLQFTMQEPQLISLRLAVELPAGVAPVSLNRQARVVNIP